MVGRNALGARAQHASYVIVGGAFILGTHEDRHVESNEHRMGHVP